MSMYRKGKRALSELVTSLRARLDKRAAQDDVREQASNPGGASLQQFVALVFEKAHAGFWNFPATFFWTTAVFALLYAIVRKAKELDDDFGVGTGERFIDEITDPAIVPTIYYQTTDGETRVYELRELETRLPLMREIAVYGAPVTERADRHGN